MYPIHAAVASCLSTMFWFLPEFNYWEYWCEQAMRSQVLPHIPGI